MATNTEQYWRRQVAQTEAEYEQIIAGLRDEVERQQRRCSELVHEQAMHRATAAADVRDFCQQYAAKQQPQQLRRASVANPRAVVGAKEVQSVPLPALFAFLHEYSHGLMQLPENRRKRQRPDAQVNPLHHRLRQRMLARQPRPGAVSREEDGEDWEYGVDGITPPSTPSLAASPLSSSPTWPARHVDAESGRRSPAWGASADRASSPSSPQQRTSSSCGTGRVVWSAAGRGSGVGEAASPVMAASVFGLSPLPKR